MTGGDEPSPAHARRGARAKVLNLPNALSVVRILLVPAFAVALAEGHIGRALALFAIAGVTDGLDGLAARRLGQETELGVLLDPMADKLLAITAFTMLAVRGILPAWLAVIAVARDVLLLSSPVVVRVVTGRRLEVRVTRLSKANTALQILTVVFALLLARPGADAWLGPVVHALVALTAATILASGVHYLYRDRALLEPRRELRA